MRNQKIARHRLARTKGVKSKRDPIAPDPVERFLSLQDDEKAAVTKEFDREFIADTFAPLRPAQQKEWRRLKTAMGRSKKGNGVKVISLRVEKDLLKRADEFAKKEGLSRAQLVARGLERELAGAVRL